MRRFPLAWLLSLLLVFAQHGALLHELGHLGHGDTAGATLHADSLADAGQCSTCNAFAQVSNPAGAAAAVLIVDNAGLLPVPEPRYTIAGAQAPTPRSRGPPQV